MYCTSMTKNETTTALKKAVKKYNTFSIHTERIGKNSWDRDLHSFRITCYRSGGKEGDQVIVTVSGRVRNGHDGDGAAVKTETGWAYHSVSGSCYEPTRGHWWLYGAAEAFQSAVAAVPAHAVITLEVGLDGLSNGYCAEARLHADTLSLVATWTDGRGYEKKMTFLLDVSISAHNSARFGAPTING